MHSGSTEETPTMRSTLIRAVLVAVLSITTTLGLLSSVVATASTTVTATTELNVRAKPSTKATIVGSLHRGQSVKARSDSGGWTKITYKGKTAYVSSRYLTKGEELPAGDDVGKGKVMTTTTEVNLREGPALSEDVVAVLDEGTKVTQTGKTAKGWTEVTAGSKRGWVSTQYLAPADVKDGLPAVTGTRTATVDLNVRATSDEDSKLLGLARKGTKVSITGTTDNARAQIIFEGKIGWVLAKYLSNGDTDEPTAPALPAVTGTRYATADLTIRTTSGSDFVDLGDIAKGTKISITGVNEHKRAQIIWDGAVRWVTAQYLSKTKQSSGTGGSSAGSDEGPEAERRQGPQGRARELAADQDDRHGASRRAPRPPVRAGPRPDDPELQVEGRQAARPRPVPLAPEASHRARDQLHHLGPAHLERAARQPGVAFDGQPRQRQRQPQEPRARHRARQGVCADLIRAPEQGRSATAPAGPPR